MNDQTRTISSWPAQARLDSIADLAGQAAIVGLGTSTREAHELFLLVEHTTRELIDRGFRVIAVLDNQRVGDLYDRFVQGEDVEVDAALAQAWGPWQTKEMRDALTWLRDRNRSHPGDPVRFIAVGGSRVLPADYDRVIDLLNGVDTQAAQRVAEPLGIIRTAHTAGEHVQRAQGTHPGTPFAELAASAQSIAARLAESPARDEALRLLDAMVEHHANAIGAGYDFEREEHAAADRLLRHHRQTGERIVFWEGSAHIEAQSVLGADLRRALGEKYFAVDVIFGQGTVRDMDLPAPSSDSLEAAFLAAQGERVVDLRSGVPIDGRWRTRLISGVYDPARDDDHYHDLPSLPGSFDAIAFIPEVTPVHRLGT